MKYGIASLMMLLAVLIVGGHEPPQKALPTKASPPNAPAKSPEAETIKLTIRPSAVPEPALKYKLLPELGDQSPGNAALLYYRALVPELTSLWHDRGTTEKIDKLREMPIKDLPRKEMEWIRSLNLLGEIDLAARREFCDWELTARARKDGMHLMLPDLQSFRSLSTLLALRARLELADGRFDKASYTLQTAFSFSRHIAEGPTLIHALVAAAIASIQVTQVEEFIQAPNSPNLYWSLTDLPRPFIDLRRGIQVEKFFLEAHIPGLRDLEIVPLSNHQVQTCIENMERLDLGSRLAITGLAIKGYPDAKKFLLAKGWTAEKIESFPALQVVLIYSIAEHSRLYDEMYKWHSFPYWQVRPGLKKFDEELLKSRKRMDRIPFAETLLPAVHKVYFARARLDRRIAALRCIEAIRLYAAAHAGSLPASLGDIKEVPIPIDPISGKAFEYKVSGAGATLYAPPPEGEEANRGNTLKYELIFAR